MAFQSDFSGDPATNSRLILANRLSVVSVLVRYPCSRFLPKRAADSAPMC